MNAGGLKRRGDTLFWWPQNYSTAWCPIHESGKFHEANYRGIDYWATFTMQQYVALPFLVRWLQKVHGIPGHLLAEDRRGGMDWGFFRDFQGVASHQNFRADKTDIGPAFDWSVLG